MSSFKNCDDCERPSNNQYFNCPPRMADGRHFTDYRPRCTQQFQDKVDNKLLSSYEHRMFLMQNASEFMKRNALNAYMFNRCGPCVEPYDQGTMVPEFEKQVCNERVCSFGVSNAYGLGLGRQFYTDNREDEFKQRFLEEKEKEQAYFKNNSQCCGTVQDSLQYYPIDGVVDTQYSRMSVPSGGMPLSGGDSLKI